MTLCKAHLEPADLCIPCNDAETIAELRAENERLRKALAGCPCVFPDARGFDIDECTEVDPCIRHAALVPNGTGEGKGNGE